MAQKGNLGQFRTARKGNPFGVGLTGGRSPASPKEKAELYSKLLEPGFRTGPDSSFSKKGGGSFFFVRTSAAGARRKCLVCFFKSASVFYPYGYPDPLGFFQPHSSPQWE